MKRKILFFGDYFLDFYSKQELKTKEKIDFVLDLIRNVERVPIKFLKYLEGTDGLYEVRVLIHKNNIRIFGFFDEGNLIILINGFIKKTNKTPKNELELGIKLKEEYFLEKAERNRK
ncbi:MAG: type II toxin-antitoxin system RelE/ParE family toxin [Ignavibacteriales bacterium]|nr:type II toxin-antitoxin system RelE/ParE family toxin [Ignavibacteriales bacterium]